ncbi:hypothetical protein [Croceimicrobium hydrocarbonivorans]|uniref:Uncharacterized protein n=1 Tax=Croceimicrobium hydrocarbonivorans TaxID=2761580 RepID=A0A7H0VDQ7_9FLAO|nr:hypothetical protein [Croceimicrobium hydrocarbonivorans]QNR23855.1 hypothetical protein H4K34_15985 [Croceimicrobium hydrocarbonivorans]
MKIKDYTELDPKNPLRIQFECLVITLIAMTYEPHEQIQFYGEGTIPGDEMLLDFDDYYSAIKERMLEEELISEKSRNILDEIGALSVKWSSEKDPEFWKDLEKYREDWNPLRKLALSALKAMKMEGFMVKTHFSKGRNFKTYSLHKN